MSEPDVNRPRALDPPTGRVTLVHTDVQGSSALWQRLGDAIRPALALHDALLRAALEAHGGYEVQTAGDAFFLAFADAAAAVRFAVQVQRDLHAAAWPDALPEGLQVRIGLHRGEPWARIDPTTGRMDYGGPMSNRAARIGAAPHGGQTVASDAAWQAALDADAGAIAAEIHADDLGLHGLRGLDGHERLWQLTSRDAPARRFPPLRTEPLRKTNLQPRGDAFVGREDELRGLGERLDAGARLLTLLGPGGMGKTRLSQQFAAARTEAFPGGAWFCDLTEARDEAALAVAVGRALDVPLTHHDPIAQLGAVLAGKGEALVVLDNAEQVVDACAAAARRWLAVAPGLRLLVTSRIRLAIEGEDVVALQPLPLAEAVALFCARAASARPGFPASPEGLDAEALQAVRTIAVRLDCMSLPIELAAARVRSMSPPQIASRLDRRFALLAGADRDRTARQATLRGAIDWSWDLLQPWEREAMCQCAVFRGGFTLDDAEAVLALDAFPDAPWAADAVQSLIDQSLLWLDEPRPGQLRVRCYESIHAYALERRAADASAAAADAARHGACYARLGRDDAIDALHGHGGVERRWALFFELENLQAAQAAAQARGDWAVAAACALASAPIYEVRGPFALGAARLDALLAAPTLAAPDLVSAPEAHASSRRLRYWRGFLRRLGGSPEAARDDLRTALAMQREAGDLRGQAYSLAALAILDREQGQTEAAREGFAASLALHRQVGNRHGEGVVLAHVGLLAQDLGDREQAQARYEAAFAIYEDVGDRRLQGRMLGNLGLLAKARGELDLARELTQRTLAIAAEVGDHLGEGIALGNLGDHWLAAGAADEAEACLRAAVRRCDETLPMAAGAFRGSLAVALAHRGAFHDVEALLAQGEAQLRGRHAVEFGKLCCKRVLVRAAMLAAGAGDAAALDEALRAADAAVGAAGASEGSELGRLWARAQQTAGA
ncbi:MAG: hypothetical protein RIT45_2515 [Pseudomonadota bacterium]